jgi:hypothetical protein
LMPHIAKDATSHIVLNIIVYKGYCIFIGKMDC